jgi:hypothetical protein
MPRPKAAHPALTPTAMITRSTTMITGPSTTTIMVTTITTTLTTTPAAIIQITGTTMGIANDLEADCPELPVTAVRR